MCTIILFSFNEALLYIDSGTHRFVLQVQNLVIEHRKATTISAVPWSCLFSKVSVTLSKYFETAK